jgi:nitroreductase
MIAIDPELLRRLVARARLAPSVHNIQPTRFSLDGGAILLLGERDRRLPAADPAGLDVRLSHGAALEGLALALSENGLAIAETHVFAASESGPIARVAAAATSDAADPLGGQTALRSSWRGGFLALDAATQAGLARLAAVAPDLLLVQDRAAIRRIAALADRAGLFFLRDTSHRRELRDWMRLSRGHRDYRRDGLNAEALALSRLEALGAGVVLGPAFPWLDRIGLAGTLTAEAGKAGSAAAMALLHRPEGEDALETGRAFYRAWLAMAREGLAGCPVSVLVDWSETRAALGKDHPLPAGRRLINVFRIGVPAIAHSVAHARLPVDELIRPGL